MTNLSSEQEAKKEDSEEPEIVEIVLDPDTVYKVTITMSKTFTILTLFPIIIQVTNLSSEQEAEKEDSEEIVPDPDTVYKVTITTITKPYAIFTIYSYNTGDKPYLREGGRERRF